MKVIKKKAMTFAFCYVLGYFIFFIAMLFVTAPQANTLYTQRQQLKRAEISKIAKTLKPSRVESATYTTYNDGSYNLQFVKDHQKRNVDLRNEDKPAISSDGTIELYSFYSKNSKQTIYATDKLSMAKTIYGIKHNNPILNDDYKFKARTDTIFKMFECIPFFLFVISFVAVGTFLL